MRASTRRELARIERIVKEIEMTEWKWMNSAPQERTQKHTYRGHADDDEPQLNDPEEGGEIVPQNTERLIEQIEVEERFTIEQ